MSEVDENEGTESSGEEVGSPDSSTPPKITLDRYMSRRRPPARAPFTQIASLLMMLIALIMIFVYKDRCGLVVADFFGGMEEKQGQQAKPGSSERSR